MAIIVDILLVALFLFSKLLPHRDKLDARYRGIFDFFGRIFQPVLRALTTVVKPVRVGYQLSVDMAQVILFAILLILINILT